MGQRKQLQVKAVLENVPCIIDCVGVTAREAGFDDRAVHQIQIAVDEACANVVEHAYEGLPPGQMQVTCCLNAQDLVIRVRDWGRGFDPDRVTVPDVQAPLEERGLGGLGVFLMHKLMDEVRFRADPEHGNELVMVKRCRTASTPVLQGQPSP